MSKETPKNIAVALLKVYQKIGPYLWQGSLVVSGCRFYPSCSEYAVQSITNEGLAAGLLKSARRVLRCNPFFPGDDFGLSGNQKQ